jgi:hypothetical protein
MKERNLVPHKNHIVGNDTLNIILENCTTNLSCEDKKGRTACGDKKKFYDINELTLVSSM